jgi:hypothetical protein
VEGRENKDVRKKIPSLPVDGRRNKEVREWSDEITKRGKRDCSIKRELSGRNSWMKQQ